MYVALGHNTTSGPPPSDTDVVASSLALVLMVVVIVLFFVFRDNPTLNQYLQSLKRGLSLANADFALQSQRRLLATLQEQVSDLERTYSALQETQPELGRFLVRQLDSRDKKALWINIGFFIAGAVVSTSTSVILKAAGIG